jgi:translation initiation factor 1
MSDRNARTVYSTATGGNCPGCGWPQRDCKCSSRFAREETVPARVVAKLRIEKKGRGGKTVTVVYDLPNNATFLKELAGELKRACGTGGSAADAAVEIQGDQRERVRDVLLKKGWTVTGEPALSVLPAPAVPAAPNARARARSRVADGDGASPPRRPTRS